VLGGESAKASTEALLRLVRDRDHPRRLARATRRQGGPYAGAVLIVPAGFNQHPTHEAVAHLGDPAASMLLATGVFPWHQSQIRHQRARRREAPEVV
jgi:hypothetical protein